MSEAQSKASADTPTILDVLAERDRQFLLDQCQRKHYSKGEYLFSKGDEGSWVLLIHEGMVEISVTSINGRKSILALMEPGEMLGEISLLDRQPRSADAVAKTDVSGMVIHSHTMLSFLHNNPDSCMSIIETLCKRVRNASDMFETQSLTNAGARLARTLIRIADKWGTSDQHGHITIDQTLSQSDLGDFAGIARENANRYIKTWTRDELLRVDQGVITLIDRDKLMVIAEQEQR